MKSRLVPVTPWQLRRQRILHGICRFIWNEFAKGKRAGRTYKKAAQRWNQSKLARERGRHLGVDGMRAIFAIWKKEGRNPAAFAPKWRTPDHRKITPAQAIKWGRRIMAQRITMTELYRRLSAEKGALHFSPAAFYLALPGAALREVRRARVALDKAERAALAILDARAKGAS